MDFSLCGEWGKVWYQYPREEQAIEGGDTDLAWRRVEAQAGENCDFIKERDDYRWVEAGNKSCVRAGGVDFH